MTCSCRKGATCPEHLAEADLTLRADEPARKHVSIWTRLGYLAFGLTPFAVAGWFAGLIVYPLEFGIATLALMLAVIVYAAFFVWPYEDEDGGW